MNSAPGEKAGAMAIFPVKLVLAAFPSFRDDCFRHPAFLHGPVLNANLARDFAARNWYYVLYITYNLYNSNFIHFVSPAANNWFLIDPVYSLIYSFNQLCFGFDADISQE